MKKLVFIIFSVIVLFSVSCIPEKNCCTLPQPSAHIMADRNGSSWNSFFVNGTFSPLDSMKIGVITTADNMYPASKIDSMNIKILYTNKGDYILHSNQVFYATFTNGVTKKLQIRHHL